VKEKIWAFGCTVVVGVLLTFYSRKVINILAIAAERRF
jgi:hypothetical protein